MIVLLPAVLEMTFVVRAFLEIELPSAIDFVYFRCMKGDRDCLSQTTKTRSEITGLDRRASDSAHQFLAILGIALLL
jgi:hypothetical protein